MQRCCWLPGRPLSCAVRRFEGVCNLFRRYGTTSKLESTSHSSDFDISRNFKPSIRRNSEFDGPSFHDAIDQPVSGQYGGRVRNKVTVYTPPENLHEIIKSAVVKESSEHSDSEWKLVSLNNNLLKFRLLSRLVKVLNYSIPNSYLWEIKTVADVVKFYEKGVNNDSSLENLAKADLPPNLSIRTAPIRFDPESDTFFGGVTAYPKSDTIVSGVKPKKLGYKGHKAKKEPHDYVKF